LFQWNNKGVQLPNQFSWFKKWVKDRRVHRNLSSDMQMSSHSISRLFKHYLEQAPQIPVRSKGNVHLICNRLDFFLQNGMDWL
jgi:hypothetical protein